MSEHIELIDHVGKQAVYDNTGKVLSVRDVPTGLRMVVHVRTDEDAIASPDRRSQRQIGFLHPNNFMHFIIPPPPQVFVDWVKGEVEALIDAPLIRVGSSPPIEAPEEQS